MPNIQNITPKTPEGEAIREAFANKFELAAADFATIELRMMAHMQEEVYRAAAKNKWGHSEDCMCLTCIAKNNAHYGEGRW